MLQRIRACIPLRPGRRKRSRAERHDVPGRWQLQGTATTQPRFKVKPAHLGRRTPSSLRPHLYLDLLRSSPIFSPIVNMSSTWEWHDPDRAIRLATHALGIAGIHIASEAGLKVCVQTSVIAVKAARATLHILGVSWLTQQIWIERLYCMSVASLPPAPADDPAPVDHDDDLRGWPRIWKRAKRILAEGFRVVLLVGFVLAGVGTFAAFLIGVMWTNETVLSVIMGSMIFVDNGVRLSECSIAPCSTVMLSACVCPSPLSIIPGRYALYYPSPSSPQRPRTMQH